MLVGGALEAVHERLLEVPVVLIGLGWIVLVAVVARHAQRTSLPPIVSR